MATTTNLGLLLLVVAVSSTTVWGMPTPHRALQGRDYFAESAAMARGENVVAGDFVVAGVAGDTASGDEHHLWFYWVNPHPTGFGAPATGPWCGEIDAARLVPDDLFQSPLRLHFYEQATIRLYSIPGGPQAGELKVGRCQDNGFNVRRSLIAGSQWTPADLQGPVCKHFCDCQWPGYAPAAGLPVCEDVSDDPAKGEFCSLCGPNAPGNCGGRGGACTQGIAFFLPTPTGAH